MFKKFLVALATLVAATAFAAVDVNKASKAELESIKGIGPTFSTLIMSERKKGEFKDWGDMITRVKGVGPRSAKKFSAGGLTVNGSAYAAGAAADASLPARAGTATKGAVSTAASAAKEAGHKVAETTRAGATRVKETVKEEKDATKANIQEAKDKRAEKKAADAASAPKK